MDATGNVYFVDILNDRILQFTPGRRPRVFRQPSGQANGQAFDREGHLYHCEGGEYGTSGNRRITRTNLETGVYEIVTNQYEGKRYNSPNDICIDGGGNLYFTDPRYSRRRDDMDMTAEGVYRVDPDGRVARILEQPEIGRPNGIAVTQDGRNLYVVDSVAEAGGSRKVWAYDLDANGEPSAGEVLIDFGAGRGGDGMELDVDGHLYVAAGVNFPRGRHESDEVPAGVYIISPNGELRGHIPIPEDPVTNLAFGGEDGRTLYVTAGKTLYVTLVDTPGQVAYPKWKQTP